jgi:hypothetical protein
VTAQAASLLASLVAAGRRQTQSQFTVFLYQATGIAAAVVVYLIWGIADPAGSILARKAPVEFIVWWGQAFDARGFLLLSLAIFAGWTLTACYRQMRLELKMRNGPLVWFAFLVFIGLYMAGFDAWLSGSPTFMHFGTVAHRLLLSGTTFGALAYVMVFLERKDRVKYRWLAGAFSKLHFGAALGGLQAWMVAYLAALIVGLVLLFWLGQVSPGPDQAVLGAMLGFLTRDVAIFVLAGTQSRRSNGDFAAIAALFALYALLPAILGGMKFDTGLVLFTARVSDPVWLSPAVVWVEALLAVAFAAGNLALPEEKAKAQAA